MNTRKASKDTGNSRIVDGGMIEFGLGTQENLEQLVDTRETIAPQETTVYPEMPKLDVKRLCACYDSIKEIEPYIKDVLRKEIRVSDLKAVMADFRMTRDAYLGTLELLRTTYFGIREIKMSVKEFVHKDQDAKTGASNMLIPANSHKYIVNELMDYMHRINRAVSEFKPSEKENIHIKKYTSNIEDLTQDAYNNRNIVQVGMALEFMEKQYNKLENELNIKSDSSYTKEQIEKWEKFIKNIPDDAITIMEDVLFSKSYIHVIDPVPTTVPAQVTPPKKKSLGLYLIDSIFGGAR